MKEDQKMQKYIQRNLSVSVTWDSETEEKLMGYYEAANEMGFHGSFEDFLKMLMRLGCVHELISKAEFYCSIKEETSRGKRYEEILHRAW